MLRQNEVKILLSFYTVEINRHIDTGMILQVNNPLGLSGEEGHSEILNQIVLYLGVL